MLEEKCTDQSAEIVKLLAVIVLYKLESSESVAFKTLQSAACKVSRDKLRLEILLYDNTPGGHCADNLPEGVRYESTLQNNGLPAACNRALEIAEAEGFDWILTLDQDTTLPEHFLSRLSEIAGRFSLNNSIAAVVPQITDNGKMLSPAWWLLDSIPRYFPPRFTGIPKYFSSAINSASTVRVSSLRAIGGYNPRFWLDYSDAYLYRQLYRHGMHIYVAGDIQVEHQLSVFDMNHRVTLDRYRNILDAGCAFWDLELGMLAGLDFTARLAYRTFYKHWKHGHNAAFRRASWEMLKKRIFQSKKRRIEDWKRETEGRLSASPYRQDS